MLPFTPKVPQRTESTCCVQHQPSTAAAPAAIVQLAACYSHIELTSLGATVARVAFAQFAVTAALQSLSEGKAPSGSADTALKISCLKLCKQHRESGCRLGAACRNLHLCRDVSTTTPATPLATPRLVLSVRPAAAVPVAAAEPVTLPPLLQVVAPEEDSSVPSPVPERRCSTEARSPVAMPTRPFAPRCPDPQSTCLRRFARRWNNPLQSSIDTPPNATSLRSSWGEGVARGSPRVSLDVDELRAILQAVPAPPPPSSARPTTTYVRHAAVDVVPGCFAVFAAPQPPRKTARV